MKPVDVRKFAVEHTAASFKLERRTFLAAGLAAVAATFINPSPAKAEDPMTNPLVALSFDDGPDPDNTPRILDVLAEQEVKATFFVIGEAALNYPEIVQRIHDEGHTIGNHSYSHANFTTLSYQDAFNEILGTSQIIESITGVAPTLFRYPFGITSATGDQAIADLYMGGHIKWHWTHDPSADLNASATWVGDWIHTNTTRAMNDYVVGNAIDGAIILLHDGLDAAGAPASHYDYLAPAIQILKSDGFEFGIVEYTPTPNPANQWSYGQVVAP